MKSNKRMDFITKWLLCDWVVLLFSLSLSYFIVFLASLIGVIFDKFNISILPTLVVSYLLSLFCIMIIRKYGLFSKKHKQNLDFDHEIDVGMLLNRDITQIYDESMITFYKNKTFLITGGGGSIGSEICRQIIQFNPKHIIIFDIYENNAFEISNELELLYPNIKIDTLIGSVRDEIRVEQIFKEYDIDIVFHTAAHKHVPLMEKSAGEAIKNNILGTLNLVKTADKYNVERFILISSDKAVNPTNVMGATKRCCEMILQYYASRSNTVYATVRFGNVLESNGSLIPLLKSQIIQHRTVYVTHRDITRYFMTIPEAVSLVLLSGSRAHEGETFVLDMGEPIKVLTLVENYIRALGLEPYKDIKIVFIGLRPGEKLYEELFINKNSCFSVGDKTIYIDSPPSPNEEFIDEINELIKRSYTDDSTNIKYLLQKIVPSYNITT